MEDRQIYMQKYREEYKDRKRRVTITMTPEEHQLFSLESEKLGLSIPETIKHMALRYKTAVPLIPAANQKIADELKFLIRNLGNNINQIAHNMHLNRHLYGPEANAHANRVLQGLQDKLHNLEEEMSSVFLLHGR
ncbi:hypothetical protein COW36_03475 [bacterium (Candidatus Blackallbacteria) CG17_big_fil_post_rev_8_21_14_2_50_48_46]|uniref:Bacterial mobilisation domain-containing protein n=1 Tax=bacterium (Candidatus Blackallbacteria) CG17_big_fil_post_rev_8_21_14_2_50_48_46 TaxID=2014261 RepID=A0A2M7G9H8_9BACT|nr:MAG: hypothetical protein COW64_25895 [bacterium (Candidatus Blackallbacteria) CG18_big_fil_WC_8_21_14_2_50_49_26]PIW18771.1 MAG: hypothetical protein COW36_03475 [bacterium (Candidatus Blackallbacteria) CG17_big_fil_post_rev_8_21_14_2_50_48_46]PIW49458.1 MAG: hypothetical protein COW20_05840 [bacterium (Candidatus Blackallbacteria) CG13_big_fil_rev_8_21_14_2_50_49_14]